MNNDTFGINVNRREDLTLSRCDSSLLNAGPLRKAR